MRKEPAFTEKDFSKPFAEENKFKCLFPAYREKYIDQTSSYIKMALERKKLSCEINLKDRFIEVSTNKKTRDPFIFIKGCEFIKLVCKCVEVEIAMKVLGDDYCGELIDIRKMVKSEKVFEKRRDRLIGKDSVTLNALKVLTDCYILVAGKVVAVVGSYEGLTTAKHVITGCMNNIHPVFEIKKMIIKKKLSEDPTKKDEDWSKYLPEMKKTHQKKTKRKEKATEPKDKKKKSKIETGECFVED
ncbi:KRR1 small subunit processome component like protein [Nosema granulosis]|uniref:KRR-R motif-containing protein 1 n=1 Tax=Nosema granulosis TaxID=83296 RepID=A0A9P6KZZ9_9MICR|nr:KRR1 small subunit processome component like protein [Nosema granulosis]